MGYIPTEWTSGDTITAEKLNNVEEGILTIDRLIITGSGEEQKHGPFFVANASSDELYGEWQTLEDILELSSNEILVTNNDGKIIGTGDLLGFLPNVQYNTIGSNSDFLVLVYDQSNNNLAWMTQETLINNLSNYFPANTSSSDG